MKSLPFIAIVSLFVGGCAVKPEKLALTCQQRDWYEIGRRDGAQGASLDRLARYKSDCKGTFDAKLETIYLNGRNAGLVEYCLPENAFETGRMDLSYQHVCPTIMEKDFLSAFKNGQTARSLELKNKELDSRIEALSEQLLKADTTTSHGQRLTQELNQLKKMRAQNQQELLKITK